MSIKLQVGQVADINVGMDPDEDYTFTCTSPSVGTVDADGIFTATDRGFAAVRVVRNSDDVLVGTVLFYVLSDYEIEPTAAFSVVPVVPSHAADTFTADFDILTQHVLVSWTGADVTTPVLGEVPSALRIVSDDLQIAVDVAPTEDGSVLIKMPNAQVELGTIADLETTLNLASVSSYGQSNFQGTLSGEISGLAPFTNLVAEPVGEDLHISWDTTSPDWENYYISLFQSSGNAGEWREVLSRVSISDVGSSHNETLTGVFADEPPGLYRAYLYVVDENAGDYYLAPRERYLQAGAPHTKVSDGAYALSSGADSGTTDAGPFEASPTPWRGTALGFSNINTTYIGQDFGDGNEQNVKVIVIHQNPVMAMTSFKIQYTDDGVNWVPSGPNVHTGTDYVEGVYSSDDDYEFDVEGYGLGARRGFRLIAAGSPNGGGKWEVVKLEFWLG